MGPSGPKWARAQVGPSGPGPSGPKWARRAQVGPSGPGPKWALGPSGPGPMGPWAQGPRAQKITCRGTPLNRPISSVRVDIWSNDLAIFRMDMIREQNGITQFRLYVCHTIPVVYVPHNSCCDLSEPISRASVTKMPTNVPRWGSSHT